MIGRLYGAWIGSQAQTTAKTLIEITAAADVVVLVERISMSQTSFDTSENLGMKVQDVATTGTAGAAITPRPMQLSDAAFGGTLNTNMSIEPTYGTAVHLEMGFNVLSGFLWTPASDDEVISISPGLLLGIMLDVAPSGSMNFSYGCTLREIGG